MQGSEAEEKLIRRAQRGETAAFEELVRLYDRQVLALALNFTGDPDEAQDIYQEVFLRVFRALPRFRFRSRFSTWLYRVTANVCLSHRSRRCRLREVGLEGPDGEDLTVPATDPGAVPEGEKRLLDRELVRQVRRAVEKLSPQQRLIFALRHYQGFKLREIARFLGCTQGAVKKQLFSATLRVRQELAPWRPENRGTQ